VNNKLTALKSKNKIKRKRNKEKYWMKMKLEEASRIKVSVKD
jgi:hypothetical protein